MSLQRKLLAAMVLPALLLVVVGTMGLVSLQRLEEASGRILADNYRSIQDTRIMERSLRRLEPVLQGSRTGPQTAASEALASSFVQALGRCERNITEPGEERILARIRELWSVVGAAAGPAPVDALHEAIEELVALNESAMIRYERETRRVAELLLVAVSATSLAALIALTVFAVISARRISRPVTAVADRLHAALNPVPGAEGSHQGGDEITRLRAELDALLSRLERHDREQNRKLSHLQSRLAFVMNEVQEGLVLVDDERRILVLNRVAHHLLGGEAAEGRRLDDLSLPPDIRQVLATFLAGDVRLEQDLGEVRHGVVDQQRIYQPRVLTVTGRGGGVEGYLLLFWDVTEQRRFEDSRRRFIAMLSHQLKTPMTSLTMSINLLRERAEERDPRHAELLGIAVENCNNLASLVSDLIEAARDARPDLALVRREVDLVRLLDGALRPLIPQAEERQVTLTVSRGDAAVVGKVDPVKFPWVVTNIVGNALRYTPPGGEINVDITRHADHVTVTVRDSGRGIAPENLERIFQPYVSLEDDPAEGSHGLGLAIAREIVEAHGGTLRAESVVGRGTTFALRLPVDEEVRP